MTNSIPKLHPVVSEKSSEQIENNKFTFVISDKSLNKIQIKSLFKEQFNVLPKQVNVINRIGKKVRRGRTQGTTQDRKFVIVTFASDQNVDSIKELF